VQNEDSDMLLRSLRANQWHNKIDIWMHDPYVEGCAELHLGRGIPDQWYDFEYIIREHQPNEFLITAKEEWERRFSFYAVLVSEIAF
jgi:hypothetical protein